MHKSLLSYLLIRQKVIRNSVIMYENEGTNLRDSGTRFLTLAIGMESQLMNQKPVPGREVRAPRLRRLVTFKFCLVNNHETLIFHNTSQRLTKAK